MSCFCYVWRRGFAVSRVDTSKCDFLLGYGFRIKEGTQFVKSAATTLRDGGVVLLPPAHYQQSSLAPPPRLSSVLLSPELLSCCQPVALSLSRRFLAANQQPPRWLKRFGDCFYVSLGVMLYGACMYCLAQRFSFYMSLVSQLLVFHSCTEVECFQSAKTQCF